jgi:hypothetical protein
MIADKSVVRSDFLVAWKRAVVHDAARRLLRSGGKKLKPLIVLREMLHVAEDIALFRHVRIRGSELMI